MAWQFNKELELYWEGEFDSAHFLFFDYESKCKRLHGHTWKVKVYIRGTPNANGVIFDFNHLSALLRELDHRLLIPKKAIKAEYDDGFIEVENAHGETLKLRKANVIILPYPNVTSEFMAMWLREVIISKAEGNVSYVKVCVMEDPRSQVCAEATRR